MNNTNTINNEVESAIWNWLNAEEPELISHTEFTGSVYSEYLVQDIEQARFEAYSRIPKDEWGWTNTYANDFGDIKVTGYEYRDAQNYKRVTVEETVHGVAYGCVTYEWNPELSEWDDETSTYETITWLVRK